MNTVALLVDAALAVGWIALSILAAGVALPIILLGHFAGDCLATRWHTRRLIRDVQLYVHRPPLRPLFDAHDQPRKETP